MKKLLLFVLIFFSLTLIGCQERTRPNVVEPEDPTYYVSFYNGDSLLNKKEYVYLSKITYIPSTSKDGYTFEGWYLSPDFSGNASVIENIIVAMDIKIYGKWTKNTVINPPIINPNPGNETNPGGTDPDDTNPGIETPIQQGNYTGYYQSLNGLTGTQLLSSLTTLVKNTGKATGTTAQVKAADEWQNSYYLIYTGMGPYGNREHVWPNSLLGSAPDYDLHNLRAANIQVNSSRANYPYGTGSGSYKVNSGKFYPGDEHVGDVARIILYISLRYNLNINLVGNLDMFLRWHQQDPVNEFELVRNNRIQGIQNNRNPFIDHPELVTVVYGKASLSTTYITIPYLILSTNTYSFTNVFTN